MNKTLNIQELTIIITAKNLSPTVLNPDFLRYADIIPSDWEEVGSPIYSNGLAQVSFQKGVSIVAQPNRVIFAEAIGLKSLEELQIAAIAARFIEKLSNVEYQAVGINPKGHVAFSDNGANKYLFETLLSPGSWQEFGIAPVNAAVQLAYTLERGQLYLSVNEGMLKLPESESVPMILFSGNFNYEVVGNTREERLQDLQQLVKNWQNPVNIYAQLVNKKFLQQEVELVGASSFR